MIIVFVICTIDMIATQTCATQDSVELWPSIASYGYQGKGCDCSSLDLKEVPGNLPTEIQVNTCSKQREKSQPGKTYVRMLQVLQLTSNRNLNLRKESFQKYTELIVVIMSDMSTSRGGIGPVYDESTFSPLTKLKELYISDSGFFHVKFKFPDSIARLFIDGNSINEGDLDLSQLKNLDTLSAIKCGLNDVPRVHEVAPFSSLAIGETGLIIPLPINGDNSPLSKLTAETMATFCMLERLHIKMNSALSTFDEYCRCTRLKLWLLLRVEERSIKTGHLILIDCGAPGDVFPPLYSRV